MKLRDSKFLSLLKEKKYKDAFQDITYGDAKVEIYRIKAVINSILFIDDDIALEYLIAEHRKLFIEFLDYIQDKAINVYFSDKCIDVLQNLETREDLFI